MKLFAFSVFLQLSSCCINSASAFIFVWIDATTKKNKKYINSLIFIYICMVHPVRDCEMTYCPISAVEIGMVV